MSTALPTVSGSRECIVHCRVSTAKQAYEGESLDVQASICEAIARDKGWSLARAPWKESFSGRKQDRPAFQEVLAFLDAHPGEVGYYLFRSIDRFTRGGSFAYEQMKRELSLRGVEMMDSYGIIQPARNTLADLGVEYDWSRSSPSEIAEVVMAMSAKHEITNILTRLIGQEIRLTRRGYKVRGPQDGYVNSKIFVEGRKRTVQTPDPDRARYFTSMFELRASGQLTDQQICDRVNAMGYRTKLHNRWDRTHQAVVGKGGGNMLVPKRLQEIIQRPVYCGVICEKWTGRLPVKAAYDGLVSTDLFNRANRGKIFIRETDGQLEILHDYKVGRTAASPTRDNPDFPHRHVIMCPICRKPLHGSSPRGSTGKRFPIYHCSRKHKYFGIKKATLNAAIKAYTEDLRFHPDILSGLRAVLIDRYRARQSHILANAAIVGETVAELERNKADAVKSFPLASTELMRRSLEVQVAEIEQQIKSARTVRNRLEITEEDIEDFVRGANMILEQPGVLLEGSQNPDQWRALYSLVFQQPPTYEEIRSGTAKLHWIFYLSSSSNSTESALVQLRGLDWNLIEGTIIHWKLIQPLVFAILSNMSPKS